MMFPTSAVKPPSPIDHLTLSRDALIKQQAADKAAMSAACAGEFQPPETLEGAARIIAGLRKERDAAKQAKDAEIAKAAELSAAGTRRIGMILAGRPEAPTLDGMERCIARLERERDEAQISEQKALEILPRVRDTFTDAGLTEVPGLAGYFVAATPMLACVEAATIFVLTKSHEHLQREGYLRRRGWRMGAQNGWIDPRGLGVFSFDGAVDVQCKRDIEPWKGLASRDWKGPQVLRLAKSISKTMEVPPPEYAPGPQESASDALGVPNAT
jgi:hypothetical protein